MITSNITLDDLLAEAKKSTDKLIINEEYMVRDLFRGFEWKRLSVGLRIKLGATYFADVNKNEIKNVKPLGKTPQNQQLYRKIG